MSVVQRLADDITAANREFGQAVGPVSAVAASPYPGLSLSKGRIFCGFDL